MSSMDFGDFLSKMGNETSNKKKKSSPPPTRYVEEERRPKPKKKEVIVESDYDDEPDYTQESVEKFSEPKQKSRINEEFMDRAYDYAQGVIKVVRNNFKTTEERVVMLESLRKAVHYYLESVGATPKDYRSQVNENIQVENQDSSMFSNTPMMSESEWNSMPNVSNDQVSHTGVKMNDLSGQEVKLNNKPPSTGDYSPRLNLGIKIAPDGKQEADLSGVSSQDINEMRVLAGMVGPEAEKREQELRAAKEAAKREMEEKENQ